ncbi:AI-2E family transporter [Chelatococcus composti]|uniref:Putative PurR-regulated permease PerM n=1 Tax=Chelatococcus composti TaxID=1743235 RepID=A0A841K7M2_9HYPH|nr:AI-2E family transporter [Chelatococcus composti]MBB6167452.1 putative PurR-regulated permease PerM [Chelatococcus composti]MBS7735657.1 AI-2E family transporter [Chelatococcus composti]
MDLRNYRRRLRWPASAQRRDAPPPDPVKTAPIDEEMFWKTITRLAVIGIFIMTFGAVLMVTRAVTAPVCAAIIVGSIVGPLVEQMARRGVPPFLGAIGLVSIFVAALYLLTLSFSDQVNMWVERAPELGSILEERFRSLREPMGFLRRIERGLSDVGQGGAIDVQVSGSSLLETALSAATPAVAQFLLFAGTLVFFLAGRAQMKRKLVVGFMTREARLMALQIVTDIERALGRYLGTVTMINAGLGIATGIAMWLIGMPSPALWGLLAFILNFVPYIGSAITTVVIFVVGLVSFDSLGAAVVPPLVFLALTTVEGQFVTPSVIGRRLTLNPFVVFIAVAFWTWIWGPIGAFLAVPILIVTMVVIDHVFPKDEVSLPG